MFKKLISIILTVTIAASTFTTIFATSAFAAEDSSANITNDDVSVQGENSFGTMLTEELEFAMAEETTSADYALTGLKIEEQTATVEYMSAIDCTILVALYDEATNQMVASGKSVASSEEDVVTVTIEAEEMPKYFVATAYMLDGNNAPLTDEFTTELYTEEIQMIKAMKATDFDEDRVLNLDDSEETNFAVYSEDTKVLEYKENYNIPVTVDDENGIYVFTNADDDLKTLVKGDILAYEYSADNIIIIKVDTIKIDGDTVTITENDAELEDVFDYVKIETAQDTSDCEVNMDGIDGVRLVEDSSNVSSKAPNSVGVDGEITFESDALKFEFYENEEENISLTGGVGLEIEAKLEFYIGLFKAHADFSLEYSFAIDVELELNYEDKEEEGNINESLVNLSFSPIPCVTISLTPSFVLEAKVSIKLSYGISGKVGFSASNKGIKTHQKHLRKMVC